MNNVLRKIVCLSFPIYKKYLIFLRSQTAKVSLGQYLKFIHNKGAVYWPMHKNSEVTHPNNIYVGVNSSVGIRPGCYLQGNGGIRIGNYVLFASNIGIISGNHGLYNRMTHDNKEVSIDDYCWIGMNVVVMPGVHLGPCTIVGAGSVVTKSFPDGYCVIGGNPAKLIKELDKEKFIPTKFEEEYYGFVPKKDFEKYAKKYLTKNKYYNSIIDEAKQQS